MKNFYAILEVSNSASVEVIKASGKALSARYHPDKQETGNTKKFREVRDALEVLLDPEKRAAYDYQLANPRANGARSRGEQQQQQPQQPSGRRVWVNGIGWVIVPEEMPGPFVNDRPAYPQPYAKNLEYMAQKAAEEMAHDFVDQFMHNMFNKGRRR
jgi:DnaJ-class molecular chaperone